MSTKKIQNNEIKISPFWEEVVAYCKKTGISERDFRKQLGLSSSYTTELKSGRAKATGGKLLRALEENFPGLAIIIRDQVKKEISTEAPKTHVTSARDISQGKNSLREELTDIKDKPGAYGKTRRHRIEGADVDVTLFTPDNENTTVDKGPHTASFKVSDALTMAARVLESRTSYAVALYLNIQHFDRAIRAESRIAQLEQKNEDLERRMMAIEKKIMETEPPTGPGAEATGRQAM